MGCASDDGGVLIVGGHIWAQATGDLVALPGGVGERDFTQHASNPDAFNWILMLLLAGHQQLRSDRIGLFVHFSTHHNKVKTLGFGFFFV